MSLSRAGINAIQTIDGSISHGLKLAGTAKVSGTAASLSTTVTQVTFDATVFPAPASGDDPLARKGKVPLLGMFRATSATLILKCNLGTVTLADGVWTPVPIGLYDLWRGAIEMYVSGGGTAVLEYVIGYANV